MVFVPRHAYSYMEADGAVSILDLAIFVTEGKEHVENNMLALKAVLQEWPTSFPPTDYWPEQVQWLCQWGRDK